MKNEKKISAFLGPTNTGKTYSAIQRLYKYRSGVVGFPLRLLARENYEFAKNFLSEGKVALITGEEKIIPKNAKYFFCTVESIPENLDFEFVAIDEVQMASDFERGYIFTEKIFNKSGTKETLFLGSRSMENILLKIHPDIVIKKKPRLSKLSYIGYKNLTRLPKRSAIIAFSQVDVYEIANKIKQSHGGVSVVLGALSPEVRNAQVKLFEDGRVDYIVATDAIGMGLNLDIKNIFFSSIKKFDGHNERFLTLDEISQISGRAGRFSNNGFFGTTCNLKKLDNETVNFVENYEYTEVKKIYWRNHRLNFSEPKKLMNSLSQKPKESYLKLKKNGSDHRYLKIFLEDKEFKMRTINKEALKILWEVCSVPDYSKNLDEYHTRFLKKIFFYLINENKCIPEAWVKKNLSDISRSTKKIAELNYKISQIRTWSFISFKNKWIENDLKFQNKVKEIGLRLSTKLHEELILEFIGEYKNFELTNSKNLIQENSVIRLEEKKVFFGKEIIGTLVGLKFIIHSNFKKSKNIFNNKILDKSLNKFSNQIKDSFLKSSLNSFKILIDGKILWDNDIIGCFRKDRDLFKPKISLFLDGYFIRFDEEIRNKLEQFLDFLKKNELPFFFAFNENKKFSAASRAINFCLQENLGHCEKKKIDSFLKQLSVEEFKRYKDIGFKVGINFFYFKTNKLSNFKQMLINIFFKVEMKNFITESIFIFDFNKNTKKNLLLFEKLGFYLLKLDKQYFLIHYEYYEKLIRRVFFFKKKQNLTFLPKNKFEKIFFDNPGIITLN